MNLSVPILHRLPFTDLAPEGVQNFAMNPVAPTVYVHVHQHALNVAAVALMYWPWVIGVTAFLLLAFTLWRTLRVLARRQRPGVPHCRACNYEISGPLSPASPGRDVSTDAPCPECGVPLTPRAVVTGRSTVRRLLPLAVPALLFLGVTTLGAALAFGWNPPVGRWPSPTAHRLAQRVGLSFPAKAFTFCSTIVEVDLETGKVLRTVVDHGPGFFFEFGVDPAGESMVVGGSPIGTLLRVSTKTGRTLNRLERRFTPVRGRSIAHIEVPVCGFAPDGSAAYVMIHGDTPDTTRVVRWSFADNSTTVLAELPAYQGAWPREALVLPGREERILTRPHFMEAYPTKSYVASIFTPAGGAGAPALAAELGAGIDTNSAIAPSPDGARVYAMGGTLQQLLAFDTADLTALGAVALPHGVTGDDVAADATGRLIACGGFGGIAVRDTAVREWLRTLELPNELYGARPAFSSDPRFVAASAQTDAGPAGGTKAFRRELVIWDIGNLRKTLAPPPPN